MRSIILTLGDTYKNFLGLGLMMSWYSFSNKECSRK